MTTQSNSLRLADRLASQGYTTLGHYPLFAITSDGGALCRHCCQIEREAIATTTGSDGWCVVALEINYENADLFCDHCGKQIEATYV